MVLYQDYNIKGNDISGSPLPIYDGEKCADECLKTIGCKGFTMAPSGAYRGCWIKSSKEFLKNGFNISDFQIRPGIWFFRKRSYCHIKSLFGSSPKLKPDVSKVTPRFLKVVKDKNRQKSFDF